MMATTKLRAEAPRCYDHKNRAELPRLCHVCQRIAVEQEIAERVVKALFAAGYRLRVSNGDDPEDETIVQSYDAAVGLEASANAVLARMFATDDEHLMVYKIETVIDPNDLSPDAWVRFVYGNDGYDVISDYTINLEDVLKPINDYADTLA